MSALARVCVHARVCTWSLNIAACHMTYLFPRNRVFCINSAHAYPLYPSFSCCFHSSLYSFIDFAPVYLLDLGFNYQLLRYAPLITLRADHGAKWNSLFVVYTLKEDYVLDITFPDEMTN